MKTCAEAADAPRAGHRRPVAGFIAPSTLVTIMRMRSPRFSILLWLPIVALAAFMGRPGSADALSLCGSKIEGANWTYNSVERGYTLHVFPTTCGRLTSGLDPSTAFTQAIAKATGIPKGQHKSFDPNAESMFEQFECHARSGIATFKSSWNLDSWRPQVPFAQEVKEKCNPRPIVTDPTPAPSAPAPIPSLPPAPQQPVSPLPTLPESPAPTPTPTYAETSGSVVHTWTDYLNAGGTEGPEIPSNDTVQIACKVSGFRVEDGNTWWYLIASSPWSSAYYASADAFYNNGQTSGSLIGTPFVDPTVPDCSGGGEAPGETEAPPQNTLAETSGSVVHTWSDYADAGGTEGPEMPSNDTVQIACKVNGFTVADGNTWWYRIASAPWNGDYYGSADAFYNNGETSGSLLGTPFVDSDVPNC